MFSAANVPQRWTPDGQTIIKGPERPLFSARATAIFMTAREYQVVRHVLVLHPTTVLNEFSGEAVLGVHARQQHHNLVDVVIALL